MEIKSDFLIIGSGIAGLTFALKAAKTGSVSLVTKRGEEESATFYAQGGIASVLSEDDSFTAHIRDTERVGSGLSDPEVVEMVVKDGPEMIMELAGRGVEFSKNKSSSPSTSDNQTEFDLGREAGHSERRIVHAGDMTGKVVEQALIRAANENKNITVYEDHIAVDLITHGKFVDSSDNDTVWGAYVLNKDTGRIHSFLSHSTIIATGGAGKVYIYTSNPDVATGDGIAMAYRAGAVIENMEFLQFHPTCLYHPEAKNFLISETLRGEGALLTCADGTAFMEKYHPDRELAPRDVVARAIDYELKNRGDEFVYLDISHRDREFIKTRFPGIYEKCMSHGFDITKEPIPVVPAAHYICGGVKTDRSGMTSLKRLYAIGETACTGLHGANRLASNSLLECLVYADKAAEHAVKMLEQNTGETLPEIPRWQKGGAVRSDEQVVISQNWDEIRRFMWNYVGIVRSDKRLERARHRIELLKREINDYYWDFVVTGDLVELRNIATVAELIIRSASQRKESRGLHYNIDWPEKDDENFKRNTVIKERRGKSRGNQNNHYLEET